MKVKRIAVLSPGEMGHAVGRCLKTGGFEVTTCLTERSKRTQALTEAAGITNVPDLGDLVRDSDLILSILVPDQAMALADSVAAEMRRTDSAPYFADCNAISPQKAKEIGAMITGAQGHFIDAGIIGGPPGGDEQTRFYVSGPHESIFSQLDGCGIRVRPLGGEAGRASSMKMCYASITKGTAALYTAALITAERSGLSKELFLEISESRSQRLKSMESLKALSAKAFRWIGEMHEIASTYDQAGVTSHFHEGAAEIYQLITDSPIGHERPETVDRSRSLEETVAILAGFLDRMSQKPDK